MTSPAAVHLYKRLPHLKPGSYRSDLFAQLFPQRRDLHDRSVQMLAPKVGIHWRALYRILRGQTRLKLEQAGDIAEALAIGPTELQRAIEELKGINQTAKAQEKYRRRVQALQSPEIVRLVAKKKARKQQLRLRDVWTTREIEEQEREERRERTS